MDYYVSACSDQWKDRQEMFHKLKATGFLMDSFDFQLISHDLYALLNFIYIKGINNNIIVTFQLLKLKYL